MSTRTWLEDFFLDGSNVAELPSGTALGDMFYIDGSGNLVRIPLGLPGATLTLDLVTGLPTWAAVVVPAFDFASLALTGYWIDYPAGTFPVWPGKASAGNSVSQDLVAAGSNPAAGTALNSHGTADFNGSANLLSFDDNLDKYVNANAGWIVCLFKADTAAAAGGQAYNDAPFFMEYGSGNASCTLSFSSSGVRAGLFTGSYPTTTAIAASTGAWHVAMMWFDGTNLKCQVDRGTPQSVAAGSISGVLTGAVKCGQNFGSSTFFDGKIALLLASDTVPTNTNITNVLDGINAAFGLAF